MNDKQVKTINAYFRGASMLLQWVVVIVGIVLFLIGSGSDEGTIWFVLGVVAVIGGFAWMIYKKITLTSHGVEEVDAAINNISEWIKGAGVEALNLDPEEISAVEPFVIVSPGKETGLIDNTNGSPVRNSIFDNLKKRASSLQKKVGGSKNDSLIRTQIQRDGDDFKRRYALNEFTVYYFGEKQVYAYSISVDLTAGLDYACNMHEMFYNDINAVELDGTQIAIIRNSGCKNKVVHKYVMFRTFTLYASGCKLSKTFLDYSENNAFAVQLQAMRSLVRERKN